VKPPKPTKITIGIGPLHQPKRATQKTEPPKGIRLVLSFRQQTEREATAYTHYNTGYGACRLDGGRGNDGARFRVAWPGSRSSPWRDRSPVASPAMWPPTESTGK
jgi:hypothetical protein